MTDRPVEPPLELELAEMYQKASEYDDPKVYRLLDVIVASRWRAHDKAAASRIVQLLDDGAA